MLGAIIGGALGLAGSVLGGKSANKGADKAADISLQVNRENNAVAERQMGIANNALNPYAQRGNAAGNQINALLGIGGSSLSTGGTGTQYDAYLAANPDLGQEFANGQGVRERFGSPEAYAQWHYQNYGQQEGRQLPSAPAAPAASNAAGGAQNAAFDAFRNSTGYQFRQQEGQNALNNGYAGAGLVRSGAAMKASQEYGQNLASGEFGNYLGYLSNQQGVGLSGASALAGVGQNYTNTVSANNNSAGTAAANAALVKGNNNPFANALSLIGGGLLGYGGR